MADPTLPGWSWAAIGAAVGSAILGAGRLLWGALQEQSKREVKALTEENGYLKGLLQGRDAELERERTEHQATRDRLGDRLEEQRAKTERVALLLVQQSTPEQLQDLDDSQENTAVHRAVSVAKAALSKPGDPFPDLENWTPTGSRRPPAPLPPPRKKLPSRHER